MPGQKTKATTGYLYDLIEHDLEENRKVYIADAVLEDLDLIGNDIVITIDGEKYRVRVEKIS